MRRIVKRRRRRPKMQIANCREKKKTKKNTLGRHLNCANCCHAYKPRSAPPSRTTRDVNTNGRRGRGARWRFSSICYCCICIFICQFACLSGSLSLSLCISACRSLYLYPPLSLCISVSLYLCIPVALYLCLVSVSISMHPCLSVSLYISVCLSL